MRKEKREAGRTRYGTQRGTKRCPVCNKLVSRDDNAAENMLIIAEALRKGQPRPPYLCPGGGGVRDDDDAPPQPVPATTPTDNNPRPRSSTNNVSGDTTMCPADASQAHPASGVSASSPSGPGAA